MTDKPQPGRLYRLTGGKNSKCIANGYSWSDSEFTNTEYKKAFGLPDNALDEFIQRNIILDNRKDN